MKGLNIKVLLTACAISLLAGGCLSIVRVPFPAHEEYSDEGACTNRVWTCLFDERPDLRVYPTIKMRCCVTAEWWKPIPPDIKGEKLYKARQFKRWGRIPLGLIWLTAPVDAAVDTVLLPYDLIRTWW